MDEYDEDESGDYESFSRNMSFPLDMDDECYDDKYTLIVIAGIVIFLHVVGLLLMTRNTSKQTFVMNQTFLIRYLSTIELLLTTMFLLFKVFPKINTVKAVIVIQSIDISAKIILLLIMTLILIDRWMITYLNIKYNIYVLSKYIKLAGFIVFLISIIPVCIAIYIHYGRQDKELAEEMFHIILTKIVTILVISYAVLTVLVYTYIILYSHLRNKKLNFGRQNTKNRSFLRMPLMIILSYLLFVIVPNLIIAYNNFSGCSYDFDEHCININFMSDALIYMLLIPRCRKKLVGFWKTLFSKCRNSNDVGTAYTAKSTVSITTSV